MNLLEYSVNIREITQKIQSSNNQLINIYDEQLNEIVKNELKAITIILSKLKTILDNEVMFDLLQKIELDKHHSFIKESISKIDLEFEIYSDGFDILRDYESLQILEDRKTFGQYYTPRHITEVLCNSVDFTNLNNKNILDPSCGVGAILLTIINNYYKKNDNLIQFVSNNLHGIDININSILMTKICIYYQLLIMNSENKLNLADLNLDNITLHNTLYFNPSIKFDYIIGNPPYYKTKINPTLNDNYRDYINGQPNVYGLFIIWSLKNIKLDGRIVLLIPQSFKNSINYDLIRYEISKYTLCKLLLFKHKANKIFKDVDQPIMIIDVVKKYNSNTNEVIIEHYSYNSILLSLKIQQNRLINKKYLLIPESNTDLKIIEKIRKIKTIFLKSKYRFGTGLFVWNQNKNYLSVNMKSGEIPIIYSNYIKHNGFVFNPSINNSIGIKKRKSYTKQISREIVSSGKKIIVKRTVSVFNKYKVQSAILNDDFLAAYPKYYIENHVNYLYMCADRKKEIDNDVLKYFQKLLSSKIINFYVSKISGNTQISAVDLNNLPCIKYDNKIDINLVDDNYFYKKFKLSDNEIDYINKIFE